MEDPSPPNPQNQTRPGIPSGPRPLHQYASSSRISSSSSIPKVNTAYDWSIRSQPSLSSLSNLDVLGSSPNVLPDGEPQLTARSEESPWADQSANGSPSRTPSFYTSVSANRDPGSTTADARSDDRYGPTVGYQQAPSSRPGTPASFVVSRPSTPVSSPPVKPKPKPLRLKTTDLILPTTSPPSKAISPSLKHRQQVRTRVLATSPTDDRASEKSERTGGKKLGIVSKAAGRFGFRQAAENVMGYNEKRSTTLSLTREFGQLSVEEKEEITRERRKFARDIRACLDACALDESRRRLWRLASDGREPAQDPKNVAPSVHASQHTAQRFSFDPEFSAFAPLLTELHRHLPAARARKPWSRTCPHHAAILAELGVAFLPISANTQGERQQALEVFGAVVRNWAPDDEEEELDRWLWLCRALLVDDRQIRNRGLPLLASFLHADTTLPRSPQRPQAALAFRNLAGALLELLHSVETSSVRSSEHLTMVGGFLVDLTEGDILEVDQTSLADFLRLDGLSESHGGLARELSWMAVGRVFGQRPGLAAWLLQADGEKLKRFSPPLILHAASPVVLRLRALASSCFLSSFSRLIRTDADSDVVSRMWKTIQDLLIPDILVLSGDDTSVLSHLGEFLMEMEMRIHRFDVAEEEDPDPFKIRSSRTRSTAQHRDMLLGFVKEPKWKTGIDDAAKQLTISSPLHTVTRMLQSFLQTSALAPLGRECLSAFWTRLASMASPIEARSFLLWLSTHQPRLFYKPLFSLSAADQPSTLDSNRRLVGLQSKLIGASRFWTFADPQMVIIVLVGAAGPKQSKSKGKEGEHPDVHIKLGRYAVLLELIKAFEQSEESAGPGSRLRGFIDTIESRLLAMLEAEEKDARLPSWYRALVCELLLKMRVLTQSLRRGPWIPLVISWFINNPQSPSDLCEGDRLSLISCIYRSIQNASEGEEDAFTSTPLAEPKLDRRKGNIPPHAAIFQELSDQSSKDAAASVLVALHACLAIEDWTLLLPHVWRLADGPESSKKSMTFLVMKCGEIIPSQLRHLISSELMSPDALLRERAFQKLANIYGWRYQVLAQRILSDRRGPVFHFPLRTLGFVTTEIGSPHWIPSHDVQDAALQKFGQSLPLELRQRLMDLGWTENDSLAGKSDWGQIPITSLPTFQYQQDGSGTTSEKSPSPARPLIRRASSGSGNSVSMRKRKVIFAPILMTTITEQADVLVNDPDGIVSTSLRELVKLLQREDSTAFLRPFTDAMTDNFAISLPRLNAFVIDSTPGFAYAALNALVGFVKTTLRNEYKFLSYSRALATISLLIPQVSEMSLRDIRKNKAEAVLLPASIHEDEAGFKLHAPWRDNSLSVQTAQLLVITEIFKANPREVYLIKKMLSNLQIQGSIQSLPFSRTWLVLIATLFQGVNRNYNDRAELRHFLQNIATILRLHGSRDVLIASHAMRVFILCSARFRRLFASMGFSTIMPSVCETYSSESFAIRDCIDYAARSFYRIHQDTFVYQTCVVIAEGESDPASAYDLLASLSTGNTISSGVSSGIRGMNDTEEVDALVQMMSGPEMANTEIGTAAAERQAQKIGAVSLDEVVFPRENIIRLLVTVIASDPSSPRARSFLRLFTGIVPHFTDPASQVLLRQGVEALGAVVVKGKAGEETARLTHHPGAHSTDSDWTFARREYIFLVESYTRSGGALGAEATRRTLEMVLGLLRRQPEAVGPAAASILGELAKTHLSGPKPVAFLRDIASLFRFFIAAVDFSGVLEQITSLIRRSGYDLDTETTAIVIEAYVEPAMRVLANASEKSLALALPFRMSAVTLLSAAVFLRGDALGAIERHPPSPGLLASVVLPFCLLLENPPDVDRDAVHSSLWIRLLHFVLRSPRHANRGPVASVDRQGVAAAAVVSLQIVKVIILRAPDSVSSVNGLWNYLAQHLLKTILDGDGRFLEMGALTQPAPRIVDWMMWSLFELLSLHRSPLHINFRYRMQTALAALQQCEAHSQPSTPGEGPRMASSPHVLGRARNPSGRSPSLAVHARMPSVPSPQQGTHSRMPSFANTPHLTPEHGGYSRMPSQNLSPLLSGHARIPSGANGRPTFADLSLRRASRPVFEAFPGGAGMLVRFPSSAPVRSGGGGAIVHLLGGPSQVLSATSSSFPTVTNAAAVGSERAVKDVRLSSEALKAGTRRAVRVCLMVFGYELEPEEDEEVVREWSVHDALHVIWQQTKLFVEDEFRDVCNPARTEGVATGGEVDLEKEELMTLERDVSKEEDGFVLQLPIMTISSP